MDVYHYAGNNPVKLVDPDGRTVLLIAFKGEYTPGYGKAISSGIALEYTLKGGFKAYYFNSYNTTAGIRADIGFDFNFILFNSLEEFIGSNFITGSFDYIKGGGGIGFATENGFNVLFNLSVGPGVGASYGINSDGKTKYIEIGKANKTITNIMKSYKEYIKSYFRGDNKAMNNSIMNIIKELKSMKDQIKEK